MNTLSFQKQEEIGLLEITREKKLNALDIEVLSELKTFLQEKPALKGLVLTGQGEKAFIAGADIAAMTKMDQAATENFAQLGQEVSFLLESLPYPVVAAVNGFALGGGCEMALACDWIYASENAIFGLPEVKLGLIPGFGGTQRLTEFVGSHCARAIIFTGRNIKSAEAQALGLVQKVFASKEELIAGALASIEKSFQSSPFAIAQAKRAVLFHQGNSRQAGLDFERQIFAKEIFESEDKREGTTAFVEKRQAQFKGK